MAKTSIQKDPGTGYGTGPETGTGLRRGSVIAGLASLVWIFQAMLIAEVFADLLAGRDSAPVLSALAVLGLGAVRASLNLMAQRMLGAAAEAEIQTLRQEIIAAETATLAPARLGGAGALATVATSKLDALRPYLLRYQPARVRVMILPPVILAISAWHSWAVAVVLLMAGPLIPVFMALVGWAAKEASEKQMAQIGTLGDLLADWLAALSDLRLIGAGPQVTETFAGASDALRGRTMAVLRIAFLSSTVLELFAALGVAMIAVWVGFSLLGELSWGAWGTPLSPFAGLLLLLLAPDFFQPLRDLAAAWHDKSAADAVVGEIDMWRQDRRSPMPGSGTRAAPLAFSGLHTRDLSLIRAGQILRFPDLQIAPGQSIALTGPSGAGKTTLLRLLAALEQPSTGDISLAGACLDEAQADRWRSTLGWMPQQPRFVGRSLRYNIGFGRPLDRGLADTARLTPVLASLPRRDLTQLGEKGAGLSGGEARRVMLARALHGGPALLLADEPTADLDTETAREIIAGLQEFVSLGGTLIAATHDPRLVNALDREIRLEPGP